MGNSSLTVGVGALAALLIGTSAMAAKDPPQAPDALRPKEALLAKGKASYDQWCLGCHGQMPGQGMFPPAGTFRLQQRYQGRLPAVLEERTDLQPAAIRLLVRRGINVMPPTRRTEVTDQDLEAIILYLTQRNSGS